MAISNRIITRDELDRMLWGAVDILLGTTDAADFKNHILSLLFLKRLNDVFDERRETIRRPTRASHRRSSTRLWKTLTNTATAATTSRRRPGGRNS